MIRGLCDNADAVVNEQTDEISEHSEAWAKDLAWIVANCRQGVRSWFDPRNKRPKDEDIVRILDAMFLQIESKAIDGYRTMVGVDGSICENIHLAIDEIRVAAARIEKAEIHSLNDPATREAVWAMTNGKCTYCGCQLSRTWAEGRSDEMSVSALYIEHVVPRSAGGPDNLANYVPSCHGCNTSKGSGHVLDFINRKLPARLRIVGSEDAA